MYLRKQKNPFKLNKKTEIPQCRRVMAAVTSLDHSTDQGKY
jgi:hypothetical protein